MSSDPSGGPSGRSDDPRGEHRRVERQSQDDAWAATGLLLSGVAVWGGAGWLVARWLDNQLFVMIGLLLGTGTALYGIWFRYGRS